MDSVGIGSGSGRYRPLDGEREGKALINDGASVDHLLDGKGHPRTAGTYARVLGHYVREERRST